MLYDEWEPIYETILADFGYDRVGDETARDLLGTLVADNEPLSITDIGLAGTVAVCGGASTLGDELDRVRRADSVVAASNAAKVCVEAGIDIDCVVTDLDKTPRTAIELSGSNTPVAVHAHGDNTDELEQYVPEFTIDAVLPTTQAAPAPPVGNPGGFTDGDRAAFLADACGAGRLVFPGWSFDDPTVSEPKARKLRWAERLLFWLEARRNERFDILDGRRDRLDRI